MNIFLIVVIGTFALANAKGPAIYQHFEDGLPECTANRILAQSPFKKVGEKYYLLENGKKMNWYSAAHECRKYGAHLVTIETEEEMQAITKMLNDQNTKDWVWIGANSLSKNGEFLWISNGEKVKYTNWSQNQPDNTDASEPCVHMWYTEPTWTWNDIKCETKMHYMCQATEPRSMTMTIW